MKCLNCNIEFTPYRGKASQKFCSSICKTVYSNVNIQFYTNICGYCKEEFRTRQKGQKFCSVSCGAKGTTSNIKKTLVCTVCGQKFIFNGRTSARYCSECRKRRNVEITQKCQAKKDPSKKVGVGSGYNQHGYSNECLNYKYICYAHWPRRCVICGTFYGVRIDVHHVDGNPLNNLPTNLVPLCVKCHEIKVHNRNHGSVQEYEDALFNIWKEGRSKIAELSENLSNETTRTEGSKEIELSGATTRSEETIISHEAATSVCQTDEKIV